MNLKELDRGEMVAIAGGILLGVSLFLSWYSLGNRNAVLGSCHGPDSTCSGWASLSILRFLFVIVALAPLVLAWIIVRGHALSWPRGELTAVTALIALIMTLFLGVIDHPGSPPDQISVSGGWWLAVVADLLILTGAVFRSKQSGVRRKPPGVL
ncbi:MAG TPA: hypothetical protein VHX62_14655 [Solirubrobacteraceae bacterium]|jgi:hypothetical protein|nr:hypothetical protein [Solirubrobacteraceae bacterium]